MYCVFISQSYYMYSILQNIYLNIRRSIFVWFKGSVSGVHIFTKEILIFFGFPAGIFKIKTFESKFKTLSQRKQTLFGGGPY